VHFRVAGFCIPSSRHEVAATSPRLRGALDSRGLFRVTVPRIGIYESAGGGGEVGINHNEFPSCF